MMLAADTIPEEERNEAEIQAATEKIKKQVAEEKKKKSEEGAKEVVGSMKVDWDEVYDWAFGYSKANTTHQRMASRFYEKHGIIVHGTTEQIELKVLELYNER